jgi:hypothetical protein
MHRTNSGQGKARGAETPCRQARIPRRAFLTRFGAGLFAAGAFGLANSCSGGKEEGPSKNGKKEPMGEGPIDAGSGNGQDAQEKRPEAGFGKYVENPFPLGGIQALPCKRPEGKDARDAGVEERYGENTTLGKEIRDGVITIWTHACRPSLRELKFFQELHVEGKARVFGLQHRENPVKGPDGQFSWEDKWGATYLEIVKVKGITFPQFAVLEGDINRIQAGIGVPQGKEAYPFTAVVSGGKIVYYATGAVWDERLDHGKRATKATKAIQRRWEEFKERKDELLSVAAHYLSPK